MKRIHFAIVLLTFIGLLFSECTDKIQSPTTASDKTLPSLSKTTGPGAYIIEYEATHAYAFLDEHSGFILTLGIKDPSEFCSGTLNYDSFSFMDLSLPNSDPNLRRLIRNITGENISAFVWQFESVPANLFTYVCSNPPLAGGTANFISRDNDYYNPDAGGNNINSFGTKVNGTLTGTDGQTYKLNLVYQALVDRIDRNTLFKEVLTIHLTPSGR